MRKEQRHIPMAIWLFVLGVGLIATPSAAQLSTLGNQLWFQDSPGIRDASEADDLFGKVVATGDFDNDGYDDLAIGVRNEEFVGGDNVGAVEVLYGGPNGLSALFDDLWHQDSPGILGDSEAGDRFGHSLAAGDFNDDGYDDLAIGIPFEDIGGIVDAGAVQVLYGSAVGLSATDNQLWFQDSPGISGDSEDGDWLGSTLAVGDFNNSGYDDLAIGSPGEDLGGIERAGAVHILHGTFEGLTASFSQVWSQGSPGIIGELEDNDGFGSVLAVGDFDHDSYGDLAIGVPSEDLGDITWAGVVHIIYGTSSGLSATDNQLWHEDSPGILDTVEDNDGFGSVLAVGDFDNDFYDDLAIGNPEEDIGAIWWAGTVQILYGSASGISAAGNQLWHQDSPGIFGTIENADQFGSSLAVGDFDDDSYADLAIGVPDEDLGALLNTGGVHIFYGAAAGLTATDSEFWHQDSPGMLGVVEEFDSFGASLAAGDFDNNGFADLAVGIPEEDIEALEDAGAVQIVFGGLLIFSDGFESGNTSAWSETAP